MSGRESGTRSDSASNDEKLIVGKITGAYGVKGWVKVYSWTEPREGIVNYDPWYLKKPAAEQWQNVQVLAGKRHGKTVIAKLDGIDDRDQAELLTGQEIAIKASQLSGLEEDEYYWRDLIGCSVSNQQGEKLGEIISLMETGANDVLVVKAENGVEHLIPWVLGHTVLAVDIEQGHVAVDWESHWSEAGEN